MRDIPMLKMTDIDFGRMRTELLTPCGREHKLYAELGRTACGFVVRRILVPDDDDYLVRSPGFVHIRPEWMMRTLFRFRDDEADGILEVHSHPFCDRADFSCTDDHYILGVRDDFQRKRPGSAFLRMVVARDPWGFSLEYFDQGCGWFRRIPEITVVGEAGLERLQSSVMSRNVQIAYGRRNRAAVVSRSNHYSRVAAVRTPEEHAQISAANGVVVGTGGTGWLAAQLLACLGVGELTLVDGDRIEEVNLNRLVGATAEDVRRGVFKVERLAAILRGHDPNRRIAIVPQRFPSRRGVAAVQRANFVICAVDHPLTRLNVLRLCARHLIPVLDVGSSIYLGDDRSREAERHSHAWLFVPGRACWLHMGLREQQLDSDSLQQARRVAGYVVDDLRVSPGSVQTINAAIVSMGVTLLEAYLAGRRPVQNVVLYDERVAPHLAIRVRQFKANVDPECGICGAGGELGLGDDPFDTARDGVPLALPAVPTIDQSAQPEAEDETPISVEAH